MGMLPRYPGTLQRNVGQGEGPDKRLLACPGLLDVCQFGPDSLDRFGQKLAGLGYLGNCHQQALLVTNIMGPRCKTA